MADDLPTLLQELDARIRRLEALPQPEMRDQMFTVLQLIDTLHRTPVTLLAARLKETPLWEALLEDEAVTILFTLYDQVPLEGDELVEAADPTWIELPVMPAAKQVRTPIFSEVAKLDDLSEKRPTLVHLEDKPVLLVRAGADVYAYEPRCPSCGLSLEGAALSNGVIVCPWQNCAFELRSGRRVDGEGGTHLRVYPASVAGGLVRLAADMTAQALFGDGT